MKIGVVTPQYWPSRGPSALFFHALVHGLSEAEYKVIVFCSGVGSKDEKEFLNVRVIRTGGELGAGLSRGMRAFRLLLYHLGAFMFVAKNRYGIEKWIIDGPLYWNAGAVLAAVMFRRNYVYLVHDIYPDVLIAAGLIKKNSWLSKILGRLERWPMDHSRRVYTLSKGMSEVVEKRVKSKRLVSHHPFPVHPIFSRSISRKSMSWPERPTLLYAGGLGIAHELRPFAYWAEGLSKRGIVFRLVADYQGTQWEANEHIEKGMPVSWDELPKLYRSCSAGYVGLPANWGEGSLPSKVFSIMACGRPVVVVAEQKSELFRMVSENGLGLALTHAEALSENGMEKVGAFLLDEQRLVDTSTRVLDYIQQQHSLRSIATRIAEEQ